MAEQNRRTRKQKRLMVIAGLGIVLAIGIGAILYGLRSNITYFYSPTDLVEKQIGTDKSFRLGGLVKVESLVKDGEKISFTVTDGATDIGVSYIGILPDLFREGQGVIAQGRLNAQGTFDASNVLAKHDETYMPREITEALKEQGTWQGDVEPDAEVSE